MVEASLQGNSLTSYNAKSPLRLDRGVPKYTNLCLGEAGVVRKEQEIAYS